MAKWQTRNSCQCAIPYDLSILVMSRCSSNFVHLDTVLSRFVEALTVIFSWTMYFDGYIRPTFIIIDCLCLIFFNENILKSNCISNSIGKKYSRDVLACVASNSAQIIARKIKNSDGNACYTGLRCFEAVQNIHSTCFITD